MSKAKKGLQTNKTYQTEPLFKDKFRPAVSTQTLSRSLFAFD